MKRGFIFAAVFVAAAMTWAQSGQSGLTVNEPEIRRVGGEGTVEFVNYTGPYSKIDSAQAIRDIGGGLGRAVSRERGNAMQSGETGRYSIIHAVDASTKDKLDADILILGERTAIDHVKNLRRIIAGYLTAAYGYADEDAEAIAVFVTVYNAVYRGDLATFQSRYKDEVTKNLDAAKCGLSVRYDEWPGNTQIVIPLYDAANGDLSTVDTSVISDGNVIKSMQNDEDKNIDSRKQMVDIKEREADEASDKAAEAQKSATEQGKKADAAGAKADEAQKSADSAKKNADEAQKNADAAQKSADAAKKDADAAQKAADEAKAEAAKNPDDKKAQEKAEDAQKSADEKKQTASEEQKKASEEQKKADTAKDDADKAQSDADTAKKDAQEQKDKADEQNKKAADEQQRSDKKQSEADSERQSIAKDQSQVINREEEEANAGAMEAVVYGLQLVDEKTMSSGMVRLNSKTGRLLRSSPVTVIRGRTMYVSGDNFIAIAGEKRGNGAVKLVTLDKENMEITAQSNENIAEDSILVMDGGDYYCVVDDGGKCCLARFGADLRLKQKSPVTVNGATPITMTGNSIIVTDSNGKPVILNKSDLKAAN